MRNQDVDLQIVSGCTPLNIVIRYKERWRIVFKGNVTMRIRSLQMRKGVKKIEMIFCNGSYTHQITPII